MKKLCSLLLFSSIFAVTTAQTNVSGIITSNTTWTLANSPYIVVDTIVVLQNVALTIQPGVVVKFYDHKYLEIRQGVLIANGTTADSITFTSNNPNPTRGIWGGSSNVGGIFLNGALAPTAFNYCNVNYAMVGILGINGISYLKNSTFTQDSLYAVQDIINTPVDSCVFRNNGNGISSVGTNHFHFCTVSNNGFGIENCLNTIMTNCTIDSNGVGIGGVAGLDVSNVHVFNCKFRHNQLAFSTKPGGCQLDHCIFQFNSPTAVAFGINGMDSLVNSEIKFNGTGVYIRNNSYVTRNVIDSNNVGIELTIADPNIYCNAICNNTSYGLQLNTSSNVNVANNYWCTPDSASTEAVIYDIYDNLSEGIVTFMPLDSTCAIALGEGEIIKRQIFTIYPSPTHNIFTISFNSEFSTFNSQLSIYDVTGREVHRQLLNRKLETVNCKLNPGVYLVKVQAGNSVMTEKLVVE